MTLSEIAKQIKVHPNQVTMWKKQLLGGTSLVFESGSVSSKRTDGEPEAAEPGMETALRVRRL